MKRPFLLFALLCATQLLCPVAATAITMATVPVGDAGNAADQNYGGNGQFGAVVYNYNMGTYEVTNSQYVEFLNAKATQVNFMTFQDPLGLYNSSMQSSPFGGIIQIFNPEDFSVSYMAKANMGNKPVNFVSFYDTLRFVNWLDNGGGTGSTESGSYTIQGGTQTPSNGASITRSGAAVWVLPTENEWYKAAYYQPVAQGGDSDGYWLAPTRSNVTAAVYATANSVGDINNPGPNVMNESGASWNGQSSNMTTVGTAGSSADSYYGTYDQGGNIQEWLENREERGGNFGEFVTVGFRADQRTPGNPTTELPTVGFRVAKLAPPLLVGDFNKDQHVNAADIRALELALTNYSLYKTTYGVSDADLLQINNLPGESSTALNNSDLQALESYLIAGGGSTSSVPEPNSVVLAGIAGCLLCTLRRRFRWSCRIRQPSR